MNPGTEHDMAALARAAVSPVGRFDSVTPDVTRDSPCMFTKGGAK